jgi:hypothetical protein
MLSILLHNTSVKLLKQTGLGEVFEDAVMPTLLFLPSLTPVNESLRLLPPAYATLYQLADKRYPDESERRERLKYFDRIMRHGALQGFHHAHENASIVAVIVEQVGVLIEKMGLHAVKHLKVS